jgi:NAD(P)-dependent dehydrogenase (short-subunit alcohol dehydrogenase family)
MSSVPSPHTIIFGGTSLVGGAGAELFAQRGHCVSVIGRRPAPAGSPFAHHRFDLSRVARIPALLAKITKGAGPWSNLVFVQRYRGADDLKGEWTLGVAAIAAAIESATSLAHDVRPRSIVIYNSIASDFIAGNLAGYHAAKAAQRQLMRYYAVALGPRGIRVNCVSPATILKRPAASEPAEVRAQLKRLAAHIPLRRMGEPRDMAAAAFFLCSSEAAYITGHDLVVDGGISLLAQENLIRTLGDPPTARKKKVS